MRNRLHRIRWRLDDIYQFSQQSSSLRHDQAVFEIIEYGGRATCRARSGQARSASDEPQAGTAKPDSPRGTTCSGPANAGRFLVRVSRESVVRPTLSLYPPVAWDNGPRLWLLWVEARPSSCFWCAKRWAVGHSRGPIRPFCPFSGGHYPRAKPEDEAVGALRLVSRRWASPMRRSAPHGKSQAPRVMGVACGQLRAGSFDLWDR